MREYEQTQTIAVPADEAFAWLSDVSNLPKYLPPVDDATVEGPAAEGNPGRRIRATLEYPGEGGGTFDAEGYLAVDENRKRMEWGAEVERDYSGWKWPEAPMARARSRYTSISGSARLSPR